MLEDHANEIGIMFEWGYSDPVKGFMGRREAVALTIDEAQTLGHQLINAVNEAAVKYLRWKLKEVKHEQDR
jgi:hypothetical protein